ncbi:hypothetical protein BZL30_4725 [Mycobacterium kansasii]|uniref:Uncharacterized protein n=1 Tax=Mycobacterium kansasii TaxID=1768 RepID=A0A1V3X3Z6_MYCKA|nr:hypothetical protein BZL30_4725 [Mycobacterium kansasii]OOK77887.1 hypothetical protein BZL29_4006 [Mycobacterium kansasii]
MMVARRIRRRIRRRAVNSVAVGFAKLVEPRRVPLLSPRASGSRRRYP